MASDEDDDSYMSSDMENSTNEKPVNNASQDILSLEPKVSNMVNLTKQAHNLQRMLDHEKSSRISAEHKKKSLESDNQILTQKVEALSKEKGELERAKIDLDSKLKTLQLSFTEESERKKNADMIIAKLREQLAKSSEQGKLEMESKQKYEMEILTLKGNLQTTQKRLDQEIKEKDSLLQQLNNAKTAWLIQNQSPDSSNKIHNTNSASGDTPTKNSPTSIQQLQNDKKNLEKEISKLRDDLKRSNDLLTTTGQQLKTSEAENKRMKNSETELEQLKAKNMEADVIQLKHSAKADKDEMLKLESNLRNSEQERKELVRKVEASDGDSRSILSGKENEISRLKDTNKDLQEKLTERENTLRKLESELLAANLSAAENKSKLSDLANQSNRFHDKEEQLEEECRQGKVENVRLQSKLEAAEEKLADMKQERDSSKQQLAAAEQRMRDAEQRALADNNKKNDLDTTIRNLEERLKEEEKEKKKLSEELKKTGRGQDQLISDLTDREEELKELREQLKQLHLQLADTHKLEGERSKASADAAASDKNLSEVKTELEKSKSASERLKRELENMEQELKNSRKELLQKNEELQSARDEIDGKWKEIEKEKSEKLKNYRNGNDKYLDASSNEDNEKLSSPNGRTRTKKKYRHNGKHGDLTDPDSVAEQIALLKAQLRAAKKQLRDKNDGALDSEDGSELSILSPDEREKLKKHAKNLMAELQRLQRFERDQNRHLNSAPVDAAALEELEARIRLDLNLKLGEINDYLQQRSDVCKEIDRLRELDNEAMRQDREAMLAKLSDRDNDYDSRGRSMMLEDLDYSVSPLRDGQMRGDGATLHGIKGDLWSSNSVLSASLLKELNRSISKHLEKFPQVELVRAEDPMSITAKRISYDELLSTKRQHLIT